MNVIPSPTAELCISISAKPGLFGSTVHNAGFISLGLDYFYKAFSVRDLAGTILGIRALNIKGCSVSMPYKEEVIRFIDGLDENALEVGAVNTIVNNNGYLKGYNTDINGAFMSLKPHLDGRVEKIMILGSGGVSRAIIRALKLLKQSDIEIYTRNPQNHQLLSEKFGVQVKDWEHRYQSDATVLINATPVGMSPFIDDTPVDIKKLDVLKLVMDVIASPKETLLIKQANELNIKTINGFSMAIHQAFEQFYLYTGVGAPKEVMIDAAKSLS